jgi:hypothetical protein
MKEYSLFRLTCNCSQRMKTKGRLVKIYKTPAVRRCLNCHKEYEIKETDQ